MHSVFKKDVAIQAILYIAEKVNRADFHKICKLLYFADKAHLSNFGRTITGDTYIAMEYGPVPSNIEDIFKAIRGDSFFSGCVEDIEKYFGVHNKYILKPKQKADVRYLSVTDRMCLDDAIREYGSLSFDELTKKSHGHAWNNTKRNRNISFKDILREAGDTEEYIDYAMSQIDAQCKLKSHGATTKPY